MACSIFKVLSPKFVPNSRTPVYMKSFFTTLLAVFTAFVSLIVLGIGLLFLAALSGDSQTVKVKENTLLKIGLNGTLAERSVDDPFADLELGLLGVGTDAQLGLDDLRTGLEAAANDDRISGVLLDQGAFSAGYGALEEFSEYLTAFKASGKRVYSYGEYYTQKGAFLGAFADSAILHPGGIYDVRGVGVSLTYYKDFFDKVGIEPLVVRGTGNDFKSAVEPYLYSEMSEENRLQLSVLTDQFWSFLSSGFQARGLAPEVIDSAAANWSGMNADLVQELGFVDALGYRENVMEHFKENYELLSISDYATTIEQPTATDRIALIYANGTIGNGSGDENNIGTKNIIKALRKADDNKRVKAIVLRVNSPGGSALTSDMIHHAIEEIEKPVIVSQGNYAASGGYYISCNADAIFTNSTTITGSIGIFMSLFTGEELLENTLGLHVAEVKTHPLANFPALHKQPSEGEYAVLQKMIDRGYADFTGKVAEGRNMSMDDLLPLCGGRVWTGKDANELGLTDLEGNLSDAIAYAAKQAELTDYRIYELPRMEDPIDKYLKAFSNTSLVRGVSSTSWLDKLLDHPAVHELQYLTENPGLQAKLHPLYSNF